MNDRELLEKAAKAAGVQLRFLETGRVPVPFSDGPRVGEWNPLTDDGDALRLAVKLGMRVSPGYAELWDGRDVLDADEVGNDDAATRRAIVRAAAAMAEKP